MSSGGARSVSDQTTCTVWTCAQRRQWSRLSRSSAGRRNVFTCAKREKGAERRRRVGGARRGGASEHAAAARNGGAPNGRPRRREGRRSGSVWDDGAGRLSLAAPPAARGAAAVTKRDCVCTTRRARPVRRHRRVGFERCLKCAMQRAWRGGWPARRGGGGRGGSEGESVARRPSFARRSHPHGVLLFELELAARARRRRRAERRVDQGAPPHDEQPGDDQDARAGDQRSLLFLTSRGDFSAGCHQKFCVAQHSAATALLFCSIPPHLHRPGSPRVSCPQACIHTGAQTTRSSVQCFVTMTLRRTNAENTHYMRNSRHRRRE